MLLILLSFDNEIFINDKLKIINDINHINASGASKSSIIVDVFLGQLLSLQCNGALL